MAKVPVITDSDGPGGKPSRCSSSGAILLYLAEKAGKLLPKDMAAKYEAIEWMMVQMTTLGPMFGQHVHFVRFAPAGNEYSKSRYTTQVHRVLEVMDQRLGEKPWLGGAEYGIADIATYPWARNIPVLLGGDAAEKYRNVMRWVGVINERPAVKRRWQRSKTCAGRRRRSTRRSPMRSTRSSVAVSTPRPDRSATKYLPFTATTVPPKWCRGDRAMRDTPVVPKPDDPYHAGLQARVSQLEDDVHDMTATLGRMEIRSPMSAASPRYLK